METFSLSHALSSPLGVVVQTVVFLGCSLLGLGTASWSLSWLESWPGPVRFVSFFLGLVGVPLLVLSLLPGPHGEVAGLQLVELDGEPVVIAGFTWISSGRGAGIRHGAVRSFRVEDGAQLGHLHTRGGLLAEGCSRVHVHGAVRVCRDPPYVVRDAVTFERLGRLEPALAEHLGTDAFRVIRLQEGQVQLEHVDGTQESAAIGELVAMPEHTLQRRVLGSSCRLLAQRDGSGVEGLLRAVTCPGAGGDWILHRSTAFGEGEHLLSWREGGAIGWTTSLGPWTREGSDRLEVLDPRPAEGGIALWLVRDRVSLVRLLLDATDGHVLDADVVF